ncbi:Serine/threonine-protein kinase [Entamoeba marina]
MEKWKTFDCSNRNKTDQLSFTIYNGIITVAPKGNILPTVIIPMDSTVTISRRNTLHISSNLKRIYLAMSEENLVEAMSLLAKCRHRIVPHPRIITDYKSGPMIDLLEYAYRLVEEDELYPEECLEHFDELCEVLKYIGKKKYATKQQKITYNEEKFQKRDKPSDPPPEFPEDDLMQYVIKANPFTEVRRLESIGKGGFGEVFKAQKKSDGSIIALKILKHSIKERYVKIGQEVARMSTWKHENMIEIEKCWLYEGKVYITMPLCEIGNIKNVVKDKKHAFTLCDVAYVIQCILKPLEYIHQQGFIHRDIKPANILMMCDGSIKLIDFGLVTRKCLNPHTRSGSKQYMAPEVVLQKVYNEKADIWSVGCVTQELAEGKSPYREDGIVKLLFRTVTTGAMGLRRIKYWDNTFVDFVEKCFVYDPNTRSSARELLEHPFIDWASSSYYYKKCHGMAEK